MISVLVPYRPDGGQREETWQWLKQRWLSMGAAVELIAESDDGGAHPGEFNHPLAINRAAAVAQGSVLVIADCDTAFDPGWVLRAAIKIQSGDAAWVLPLSYEKLDKASTAAVLKQDPAEPITRYRTEWIGTAVNWSGIVVVPRLAFQRCGGYDERIAWWGGDDIAFGLTMDALWGPHLRLPGRAMHLWHPQPKRETYGHERHADQQALVDRYIAGAGDANAIEAVRFG